MSKTFLIVAALLGAVSVALGAFAAHGLKKIVPPDTVASFETGVRYQFYHTFALLITGLLLERMQSQWLHWAGYSFIIGIVLFSGSLYLLTALKATQTVGLTGIGIITPFGGLFFIAGWVLMAIGILKR
ncbi:MAG TPA: DUF423 domain-containing protein [Chitinophagaceae bacterium]|nr:DUF423 domain-containing protein [Chitinophagaceae bacterium]